MQDGPINIIMDNSNASSPYWIEIEDWHTAGEPFRIVENLPADHLPDATTVAQRRMKILAAPSHPLDTLRRTLCHEPRGHSDMYGGFITPPNDSAAHFGVLFWHKDGFSTACGHGTIALGYWAVSKGLVQIPEDDGTVDVVIDVPSGRVRASVTIKCGRPVYTDFVNVHSYQLTDDFDVEIPSHDGMVQTNLSYAGAVYASVDATQLKLTLEPTNIQKFITIGQEIKTSIKDLHKFSNHDIYGIIFFEDEERQREDSVRVIRQKNITVFADGQIDRSPCGSGTCARLAIHLASGKMKVGQGKFLHRSIVGSLFEGDILSQDEESTDKFPACIPRVRGKANMIGKTSFYIDPEDPIYPGFLLR